MVQATRSRTRLAREERREQILDAATVVFIGRDPVDVTFEEIAEAAGVSRALVYNYFGDRNGLLEALYRRNVEVLRMRTVEGLDRTDNQRSAVAEALLAHFEVAANDPAGYRYASGDPPFPRLAELEEERVTQIAELLGGGSEACLIARALLSTVHAAVLHQLDHGEPKRRRATELMAAFLTGALLGVDEVGMHTPRRRGA
jgi:AcrR family transcriptional regulator